MTLLTTIALCTALLGGGHGDPPVKPELRIKPATTIRGLHVTIGDLCEITPTNAQTMALSAIRFGPAPHNGYARAVSRTDIIRALAGAGIQLKTLKLTGSNEISVQSHAIDVSQEEMLDAATAALQAQLNTEGGDVEFEAPAKLRRVKAPPGRVSQDLRARVRNTKTNLSMAIVDIEILVDGEVFKKIPVKYKLRRFQRILKTTGTIRKDTPLGPENTQVIREPMVQVSGMYLDKMRQIAGMSAKRNLRNGQRLTLGDIMPPALIHRGDVVTVVLTRGRVKVTAKATANGNAPLDGRIQLTNLNSRSQMTGRVIGPGLVVINP
ncbi:MAG: flagella basal body P-ring formation protein FlgA [Planctomycetota bacterium]|jgi:flagella basal body P-ring formation protein FlgA